MIKKCNYCSNEFEQTNNKGSEQIYCSKICRTKSANERFKNNLIKNYERSNNEKGNQTSVEGVRANGTSVNSIYGIDKGINENGKYNNIDSNLIDCIKEKYESDVSNIFFKLKCEQLEKENNELKQEIMQLEMELDECNSESGEDSNGIISGLMTSFKKDPQSTISFASELITNFIKPKTIKTNV